MDWLNGVHWTDDVANNYCTGFEAAVAKDEKDANWYNITATTALLYGLLTLLLNVRVYFVLLKNRKEEFSSSFYVVWIATNIVVIDFESVEFDIGFEQEVRGRERVNEVEMWRVR